MFTHHSEVSLKKTFIFSVLNYLFFLFLFHFLHLFLFYFLLHIFAHYTYKRTFIFIHFLTECRFMLCCRDKANCLQVGPGPVGGETSVEPFKGIIAHIYVSFGENHGNEGEDFIILIMIYIR